MKIREKTAELYIFLMVGILPLVFHIGYTDILDVKVRFFYLLCAIFAVVTLILFVIYHRELIEGLRSESLIGLDIAVAAFGAAAMISTACSKWPISSLTGDQAYYVGALMILCMVIAYFLLSYNCPKEDSFIYDLLFSGTVVLTVGILNRLGFDPLKMYDPTDGGNHYYWLSTIGALDFFSGYAATVTILIAAYGGMISDKKRRIPCILLSVLGYILAWLSSANGIYAGLSVGFLFLGFHSLFDRRQLKNVLFQGLLFGLSGAAVHILLKFFPRGYVKMEAIPRILLFHHGYLPIILIFGTLYVLLSRSSRTFDMRRFRLPYAILLALLTAAFVAFVLIFPESSLLNERGLIWHEAALCYEHGGVLQKIFGFGCGCMDKAMDLYQLWAPDESYNQTAHNELIDYAICIGPVGALAFVGIFISVFADDVKRAITSDVSNTLRIAIAAAIAAHVGYSVTMGSDPVNFVLLFCLLSLYRRHTR